MVTNEEAFLQPVNAPAAEDGSTYQFGSRAVAGDLVFISTSCEDPVLAAKHPDIDMPGAAYDMWTEDGKRYYGSWELSNYLNFRLEDHTKLVWACEKALPYPKFAWYHDPNEERYDPLQDLALELSAGEYANYTVREVEKPCSVTLRGVGYRFDG